MTPRTFIIKKAGTNSRGLPAGTVCYDLLRHDYGVAADDTRATGIEHVSVTLDPTGDWPAFTVVKADLESVA